jgi:hypothetical protein
VGFTGVRACSLGGGARVQDMRREGGCAGLRTRTLGTSVIPWIMGHLTVDSSTFGKILDRVRAGRLRISSHAAQELRNDGLTLDTLLAAMLRGEAIEDYPTDTRGSSCLTRSVLPDGTCVHSVWGYDQEAGLAVLITAYLPSEEKWDEGFRVRRRRDG